MSNLKQSFEAELSEQALKVKHRTLQQKPVRAFAAVASITCTP
jgi:hypothetical protein